jgi:hypothetical protein
MRLLVFAAFLWSVATGQTLSMSDPEVRDLCVACASIAKYNDYPDPRLNRWNFPSSLAEMTDECFSRIATKCFSVRVETPADLGHEIPERRALENKFTFCTGHTARSKGDMSLAALLRAGQWHTKVCSMDSLTGGGHAGL